MVILLDRFTHSPNSKDYGFYSTDHQFTKSFDLHKHCAELHVVFWTHSFSQRENAVEASFSRLYVSIEFDSSMLSVSSLSDAIDIVSCQLPEGFYLADVKVNVPNEEERRCICPKYAVFLLIILILIFRSLHLHQANFFAFKHPTLVNESWRVQGNILGLWILQL